jgi:hypothetical protein
MFYLKGAASGRGAFEIPSLAYYYAGKVYSAHFMTRRG